MHRPLLTLAHTLPSVIPKLPLLESENGGFKRLAQAQQMLTQSTDMHPLPSRTNDQPFCHTHNITSGPSSEDRITPSTPAAAAGAFLSLSLCTVARCGNRRG